MLSDSNPSDRQPDRKSTRISAIRAISGKHKRNLPSTERAEFPLERLQLPERSTVQSLSLRSGKDQIRRSDKPLMLSATDLSSGTLTTGRSDAVKLLNQYNDLSLLKRKKRKKRVKMEDQKVDSECPAPATSQKLHRHKVEIKDDLEK